MITHLPPFPSFHLDRSCPINTPSTIFEIKEDSNDGRGNDSKDDGFCFWSEFTRFENEVI